MMLNIYLIIDVPYINLFTSEQRLSANWDIVQVKLGIINLLKQSHHSFSLGSLRRMAPSHPVPNRPHPSPASAHPSSQP